MDLVQYILFDTMPWESKQQGMYRSQKAEREIYGLQATGFGIVGTSEESVTDMATEPRPGSAIRDLFSSRPCPCSRESQFHAWRLFVALPLEPFPHLHPTSLLLSFTCRNQTYQPPEHL